MLNIYVSLSSDTNLDRFWILKNLGNLAFSTLGNCIFFAAIETSWFHAFRFFCVRCGTNLFLKKKKIFLKGFSNMLLNHQIFWCRIDFWHQSAEWQKPSMIKWSSMPIAFVAGQRLYTTCFVNKPRSWTETKPLFIHYLYTFQTLFIHYLYTIYTLFIHYLYTIYTLFIHYLYTF